jgi:hypothetical protein
VLNRARNEERIFSQIGSNQALKSFDNFQTKKLNNSKETKSGTALGNIFNS